MLTFYSGKLGQIPKCGDIKSSHLKQSVLMHPGSQLGSLRSGYIKKNEDRQLSKEGERNKVIIPWQATFIWWISEQLCQW